MTTSNSNQQDINLVQFSTQALDFDIPGSFCGDDRKETQPFDITIPNPYCDKIKGCEDEKKRIQKELDDCNSTKGQIQQELDDCNNKKGQIQKELDDCNSTKGQIQQELDDCNSKKGRIQEELDECKNKGEIKGGDDDGESIEGIVITKDHARDSRNCTGHAGQQYNNYYKSEYGTGTNHIGKPAWFTKDLLKQFLPDLMSNEEIMDNVYKNSTQQYQAQNYAITFECEEDTKCGNNINFTWGAPSHMWCNKGGKIGNSSMYCPEYFRDSQTSVCCPSAAPYYDLIYSKNFFVNDKCPNLILDLQGKKLKECAGKTIVAKLESPLVVLDYYGRIIDKDGNKTGIYYSYLKPHLNPDGTMKNCGSNQKCEEYAEMIDQLLWASDKEVKLKIPDNIGEKRFYSPSIGESQDEAFSYHDYGNELI